MLWGVIRVYEVVVEYYECLMEIVSVVDVEWLNYLLVYWCVLVMKDGD